MSHPFFTIAVAVTERSKYLLPLTLESIAMQRAGSLEVIFIDGTKMGLQIQALAQIDFKVLPAQGFPSPKISSMLNRALYEAKGEYLHFLMPGEFYISNHVFPFLEKFVRAHGCPDLVYGGAMMRRHFGRPEIFLKRISETDLKGAKVPSQLHPYWLRRETALMLGGFNEKYEVQEGLDLLCRIHTARILKKVFVRRIFTDSEYRRPPSRMVLKAFHETFAIIFFHFGLNLSLFRWIWNNYLRLALWWWKMVKTVFWRQDAAFR